MSGKVFWGFDLKWKNEENGDKTYENVKETFFNSFETFFFLFLN